MTATTPHLPSDYSRCHGWDDEHACTTCVRRLAIPHDDPLRMFPYMSTRPTNGRCRYQLTRVPT